MPTNIQEKIWHPAGVTKKVRGRPLLIRMQFLVPASVEVFYEWFTEFANYSQVFDHIISITPLEPKQPFEVGKRYHQRSYNLQGREENFGVTIEGIKPYRSVYIKVEAKRDPIYFKFYFVGRRNGSTMFTICQYANNKGWLASIRMRFRLRMFYFFRKAKAAKKLRNIFRGA